MHVASSTPLQRTRRKRVEIIGVGQPPPLNFIVAANSLSGFRDEDVRVEVRSQAMRVWRHKQRKQKLLDDQSKSASASTQLSAAALPSTSEGSSSSPVLDEHSQGQKLSRYQHHHTL
jgi:hypothetical protein